MSKAKAIQINDHQLTLHLIFACENSTQTTETPRSSSGPWCFPCFQRCARSSCHQMCLNRQHSYAKNQLSTESLKHRVKHWKNIESKSTVTNDSVQYVSVLQVVTYGAASSAFEKGQRWAEVLQLLQEMAMEKLQPNDARCEPIFFSPLGLIDQDLWQSWLLSRNVWHRIGVNHSNTQIFTVVRFYSKLWSVTGQTVKTAEVLSHG